MMVQRFLVPTFMDKNFNGCLRNTLAACFAFASEFGRFGASLFFLDVHVVCQQQQTNLFFCQTAFAFFSGSCMSFYNNFVEKKNVLGICEKFEMVLESLW